MTSSDHPTNPSLEEAQQLRLGDTVTIDTGPVSATGEIVDFTTRIDTRMTFIIKRDKITYTYSVDVDGTRRATV